MKQITQEEISDIWNQRHQYYNCENKVVYDDWLDEFNAIIQASSMPIIDLGCGCGNNTLYLTQNSKTVIACDFSTQAINTVNKYIPLASTQLFDMTKGLPFRDSSADLILADLCLHYFNSQTTFFIINEIKRVLKNNGHLLFRVNSVNDINHGALQGEEIEHHFFFIDEMPKRFFDQEDIINFFKDWDIISHNEEIMTRYQSKKMLWKCCVKKPDNG